MGELPAAIAKVRPVPVSSLCLCARVALRGIE